MNFTLEETEKDHAKERAAKLYLRQLKVKVLTEEGAIPSCVSKFFYLMGCDINNFFLFLTHKVKEFEELTSLEELLKRASD